ncbi:hypothetical protein [Streptomyces sp. TRM70350]|uniref:hypothetical protein n=1 Tax=Streptomyces sp. TRM70350 TaxID=2856165 RepID=UPI001C461B7E|nr:hypothetical protein [Streptomyces sp. TRM70350]MBV7700856.1 hypothetical protein [Streptomyces sp. TRM70350]
MPGRFLATARPAAWLPEVLRGLEFAGVGVRREVIVPGPRHAVAAQVANEGVGRFYG